MITINSYVVTERSVYQGVSLGVEQLLKDVNNFSKPEVVVDTISQAVMSELCDVLDFGQAPVRFTPDLMRKMWQAAQEQTNIPDPTPPTETK
jgi:hypothetical protein